MDEDRQTGWLGRLAEEKRARSDRLPERTRPSSGPIFLLAVYFCVVSLSASFVFVVWIVADRVATGSLPVPSPSEEIVGPLVFLVFLVVFVLLPMILAETLRASVGQTWRRFVGTAQSLLLRLLGDRRLSDDD